MIVVIALDNVKCARSDDVIYVEFQTAILTREEESRFRMSLCAGRNELGHDIYTDIARLKSVREQKLPKVGQATSIVKNGAWCAYINMIRE